jgi:hypothetical protein
MAETSDIDATVASVVGQLRALDAIRSDIPGAGWLEEDQIRFVRVFVEEGIEQLARGEEAKFVFMAECASLAGENMQDARIHVLEQRTKPTPVTMADLLVNLGLMLALELAVVAGATYALPAVLAFAATRLQARNARRLVTTRVAEQQRASEALEAMEAVMKRTRDDYIAALREPLETSLALELSNARVAAAKAKKEYAVALQARVLSEDLARRAQEAAAAPIPPSLDSILDSPKLQAFLDGVVAPTTVARVAENSATAALEAFGSAGESSDRDSEPFKTSTLIGRFLSETGRERNEAAEDWAATRMHLRLLTDEQFVASELAHQLFLSVHAEAASAAALEIAAADREPLILGIEGALWLTWLRGIGALGKQPVTSVVVPSGPQGVGDVNGDLLITGQTKLRPLPPGTGTPRAPIPSLVDGVRYPGLVRITDGHAEYLYVRFARGFFTLNPGAAPRPLAFDAARYDEVPSLPPSQFGFPNLEREQRIGEMKLLVIEFFRLLSDNPAEIGGPGGQEARGILRELLELAPDDDPVDDYLESLPPIAVPDAPESDEEAPSDPLGELLVSLAETSPERMARDAATKLGTLVTDLDLLITQAPSAESEELLQAIASQQDAVRRQYADFQGLASGQTALLDEVRTAYEARIDRLAAWPPPAWKFYPPEDPPIA